MHCQVVPFAIILNISAVALLVANELILVLATTLDIKAKEEKILRIAGCISFSSGILAVGCGTVLLIAAGQRNLPGAQFGLDLLPIMSIIYILLIANNFILLKRLNKIAKVEARP